MGNANIENASKGRAAPAAIDHDNIMDRIREEYQDFAGDSLDDRLLNDAQFLIDRMREVMEGRFDGVSESEVVRTRPAKSGFDVDDIVKKDVEVLLVMPRCTSTRIVELELQGCGFRGVTETEPFNAIETAVRTSPDPGHASSADLPHPVPVVRGGEKFSDDPAVGLAILGIT